MTTTSNCQGTYKFENHSLFIWVGTEPTGLQKITVTVLRSRCDLLVNCFPFLSEWQAMYVLLVLKCSDIFALSRSCFLFIELIIDLCTGTWFSSSLLKWGSRKVGITKGVTLKLFLAVRSVLLFLACLQIFWIIISVEFNDTSFLINSPGL